jgi:hypothetical protein
MMIYLLISLQTNVKRNVIRTKNSSPPNCESPPNKNKFGCGDAYQVVLDELAKRKRKIDILSVQNKTNIIKNEKIIKKNINPNDLIEAVDDFTGLCLATACAVTTVDPPVGCKFLFSTALTTTTVLDIATSFSTLCDPSGTDEEAAPVVIDDETSDESEAGSEEEKGSNGGKETQDPGSGNKANHGSIGTKTNALLLLISLAIGRLFF